MNTSQKYEKATLGGGCFWCLEAPLERVKGIEEVVSGYAGGDTADPTYQEVSSKSTGHAEVVQVIFDPNKIPYTQILDIYFALHDPTSLNKQGPDTGPQYRSIILYHDDTQRDIAEKKIEELEQTRKYDSQIVTEIKQLDTFYEAEEYHQNYYQKNRFQPYCQLNVVPKIKKLEKLFGDLLA